MAFRRPEQLYCSRGNHHKPLPPLTFIWSTLAQIRQATSDSSNHREVPLKSVL